MGYALRAWNLTGRRPEQIVPDGRIAILPKLVMGRMTLKKQLKTGLVLPLMENSNRDKKGDEN